MIKTINGVKFVRRHNIGDPSRYTWEGGMVGGIVYVSRSGKFGNSQEWHDTLEAAAERSIEKHREIYEHAKRIVLKYEAELLK